MLTSRPVGAIEGAELRYSGSMESGLLQLLSAERRLRASQDSLIVYASRPMANQAQVVRLARKVAQRSREVGLAKQAADAVLGDAPLALSPEGTGD
jgi:hypothetical protein